MVHSQHVTIAASGLMVGIAVILARLSASAQRFGRYGREGLLCASVLLTVIAVARILLALRLCNTETALLIVSTATCAAFLILVGVAYQRLIESRNHPQEGRQ